MVEWPPTFSNEFIFTKRSDQWPWTVHIHYWSMKPPSFQVLIESNCPAHWKPMEFYIILYRIPFGLNFELAWIRNEILYCLWPLPEWDISIIQFIFRLNLKSQSNMYNIRFYLGFLDYSLLIMYSIFGEVSWKYDWLPWSCIMKFDEQSFCACKIFHKQQEYSQFIGFRCY